MRKSSPSIDGFVPRRPGSELGAARASSDTKPAPEVERLRLRRSDEAVPAPLPANHGLVRSDIDESLQSIDEPEAPLKRRGLFGRRKSERRPPNRRRKIIKRVIITVLLLGLIGGIFLGVKTVIFTGNAFTGNIFDILQNQPLKQDANGRSNVLIFGTSEDDPGHEAPYLTDSIIVLSVDQTKKDSYMFNLPRDMEVDYGAACQAGYRGKINALYGCFYEDGANEKAGATALKEKVAEVTGMDIQYYAHVNYTVVREAVGAVGGIDVTIESRDPRGQMDSNFDWKCGVGDRKVTRAEVLKRCPPSGHYIDYPNGPVHLDAEHALYLAQARGDLAPTYGFEQSNFDREKNQQKVIKALREKALSVGTLTNIAKISGLIDALGNNIRTNFETKEINTLLGLAKDIQSDKIQTISLIDGDDAVMNGDGNPKAGRYQYADIQALLKETITSDPVAKEKASVVVLNGSGIAGVGKTGADKLTAAGFKVSAIDNAPEATYAAVEIYQLSPTKTATKQKLLEVLGATPKASAPPFEVVDGTDFVVIFGKAPAQ